MNESVPAVLSEGVQQIVEGWNSLLMDMEKKVAWFFLNQIDGRAKWPRECDAEGFHSRIGERADLDPEVLDASVCALLNVVMNQTVNQLSVWGGHALGENFEENPAMQAESQGEQKAVDFVESWGEFGEIRGCKDHSRMYRKGKGEGEFDRTLNKAVRAQLLQKQQKLQ